MRLASKNQAVLLTGVIVITWCSMTAAQPSAADCAAEADRASRDNGTMLGGAARGAAGGAVFGAIVGNRKSAKRGAALGAVIGGVRNSARKNNVYNSTYDACMGRY